MRFPIRPRSGLRNGRRQFTAGMGLRYLVPYGNDLKEFFNSLATEWGNIVPPSQGPIKHGQIQYKDRFRLYDGQGNRELQLNDPRLEPSDYLGRLTVAELRISGAEADLQRARWATSDAGSTEQAIIDNLGKLRSRHDLELGTLTMSLAHAVPVGQTTGKKGERKYALVPNADDPVAAYLTAAHGVVMRELGSRITTNKPYNTPDEAAERLVNGDYIPHLTVGYIHSDVPRTVVRDAARALMGLVEAASLAVGLAHEEVYDYRHQESQRG